MRSSLDCFISAPTRENEENEENEKRNTIKINQFEVQFYARWRNEEQSYQNYIRFRIKIRLFSLAKIIFVPCTRNAACVNELKFDFQYVIRGSIRTQHIGQ